MSGKPDWAIPEDTPDRVVDACLALWALTREHFLAHDGDRLPDREYAEMYERWASGWCGGDADLISGALALQAQTVYHAKRKGWIPPGA